VALGAYGLAVALVHRWGPWTWGMVLEHLVAVVASWGGLRLSWAEKPIRSTDRDPEHRKSIGK